MSFVVSFVHPLWSRTIHHSSFEIFFLHLFYPFLPMIFSFYIVSSREPDSLSLFLFFSLIPRLSCVIHRRDLFALSNTLIYLYSTPLFDFFSFLLKFVFTNNNTRLTTTTYIPSSKLILFAP